jgi:hypothetical protein
MVRLLKTLVVVVTGLPEKPELVDGIRGRIQPQR